jgi:isoamylase
MEQARRFRRPTSDEEHTFELPHLSERRWRRVIDTMQMPPHDIAEPGAEEVLTDQQHYVVGPRSVVVLMSKMHEQRYNNL